MRGSASSWRELRRAKPWWREREIRVGLGIGIETCRLRWEGIGLAYDKRADTEEEEHDGVVYGGGPVPKG